MVISLTCLGREVVSCQTWKKINNIKTMASNERIKKQ